MRPFLFARPFVDLLRITHLASVFEDYGQFL
jgi:hypothetical protein